MTYLSTFFGHCRAVPAVLPALDVPEPPSGVGVLFGVGAFGQLSKDLVVSRRVHKPDTGGNEIQKKLHYMHINVLVLGKLGDIFIQKHRYMAQALLEFVIV